MACYGRDKPCHNDHYVEFGRGRAVVYFFILLRGARAPAHFPRCARAQDSCLQGGSAPQSLLPLRLARFSCSPDRAAAGLQLCVVAFSRRGLTARAFRRAPPPLQQLSCARHSARRWAGTTRPATHPTHPPYFAPQNPRASRARQCCFIFLISNAFAKVAKATPVKYYGGKNPARTRARESLPNAFYLHFALRAPAALRVAGAPGARLRLRATPAPRFAALFVVLPSVCAAQFGCASPSAARWRAPQLISDRPSAADKQPPQTATPLRRIV